MKYKFLLLLLTFTLLTIGMVNAASCTPNSGYGYCYSSSNTVDCVKATSNLHLSSFGIYTVSGVQYYSATSPLKARCDGDYLYLYDISKKTESQILNSCGSNGCSGYVAAFQGNTDVSVTLNNYAPLAAYFVCYNYEQKTCSGYTSPSWSWTAQSGGWTTVYQKSNVQCTDNSQCATNQYCKIDNQVSSSCVAVACTGNDQVIDHKCVSVTIPKMCTDAGQNTVYQCQEYVLKYSTILSGTLQDKLNEISKLNLDITSATKIINDLTKTNEEYAMAISTLKITIADNAKYLLQLNQTAEEMLLKVKELNYTVEQNVMLIKDLKLNIADQANYIQELSSNLAIKTAYVSQLTAENDKQVELLKAMRESFTTQGQIIDGLNLTVQDDVRIISGLTSDLNEQAQIVSSLRLNVAQMSQLINSLQSDNAKMQTLVSQLNIDNVKMKALITQLTELNSLSAKQVEELQNKVLQAQTASKGTSSILVIIILLLIIAMVGIILRGKKKRR